MKAGLFLGLFGALMGLSGSLMAGSGEGPLPAVAPLAPAAVVVLSADGPGSLDLKATEGMECRTRDYLVALVTFGAKPTVQMAPGLVVRTAEGWSVLQYRYHAALRKTEHGKVQELWANLFANKLGGKEEQWAVLETTLSDIPGPDPDSITDTFSSEGSIELVSLLEGHVSYSVYITTFEGGAHNFDSNSMMTRDVLTLTPFSFQDGPSKFLAPLALARLKEVNKEREAEGNEPISVEEKELFRNGALVVDWHTGKIQFRTILDCCSWAENHNLYELEVDLPKLDKSLAELAPPTLAAANMVSGPGGNQVGLDQNSILVAGKPGAMASLPTPGYKLQGLLGVYWLKHGETLDLSKLPKPVIKE